MPHLISCFIFNQFKESVVVDAWQLGSRLGEELFSLYIIFILYNINILFVIYLH